MGEWYIKTKVWVLSRFIATRVSLLLDLLSRTESEKNMCVLTHPYTHTFIYVDYLSTCGLKRHVFILRVGSKLHPCLICNFSQTGRNLALIIYMYFCIC